jgi:hypothetical protein
MHDHGPNDYPALERGDVDEIEDADLEGYLER